MAYAEDMGHDIPNFEDDGDWYNILPTSEEMDKRSIWDTDWTENRFQSTPPEIQHDEYNKHDADLYENIRSKPKLNSNNEVIKMGFGKGDTFVFNYGMYKGLTLKDVLRHNRKYVVHQIEVNEMFNKFLAIWAINNLD